MLPYLAQGANSAIEDGAVLGILLGSIQAKNQVPKALGLYEELRKSRGDSIVHETFKQVCADSYPRRNIRGRRSFHYSVILSICLMGQTRSLEISFSYLS